MTLRICPKGHRYEKSSDCPVCPICEKERAASTGFLSTLSAPARRALEREGISTLKKLSTYSLRDLLALHGFGKSSIPKLEKLLNAEGYRFRED